MTLLEDFTTKKHTAVAFIKEFMVENGFPDSMETFYNPTDWCRKSTSEAVRLRNLGNESYGAKRYEEALQYYSESIAAAPPNSEELCLGYGNRSSALLALKAYELCILDSNRALSGPLPEMSRQTLLARKIACWERLQNYRISQSNLKASLLRKGSDKLNPATRKFCYLSKVGIDDTDLTVDYSSLDDPIWWKCELDNALLPGVSSKVKLQDDPEWGRHFVATHDIEPGEVLMIEDYYSLKLLESVIHTFCGYCSVWCIAPIPCNSCTQEMYCCIDCRNTAYDSYHRVECKLLPLLHRSSKSEIHRRLLPLRMFLRGTKQGGELTKLMNDPKVYDALDGKLDCINVPYSLNDYLSILNLHTRCIEDLLPHYRDLLLKELFGIVIPLHYISFFGNGEKTECSGNILTEEELFATLLLVHHVSLWMYYRQDMCVFMVKAVDPVLDINPVDHARAIGMWQSFMNHSCDPNTEPLNNRRRQMVYSLRPIKAGEQIFCNRYGYLYLKQNLEERQKFLKAHLNLECRCTACVEKWPVRSELEKAKNKYLTTNKKAIKRLEKMEEWMQKNLESSVDLEKGVEFCKTVRKYLKDPSRLIALCELFIIKNMELRGTLYFPENVCVTHIRSLNISTPILPAPILP